MIKPTDKSQGRIDLLQRELTKLLEKRNRGKKIKLVTFEEEFLAEGDWIYLVVAPEPSSVTKKLMLADDYVNEIGPMEQQLRKTTHDRKVLLVPAIPG